MFANETLLLEDFPISPIPCFQTAMIGWYMCFIMVFSGIVNTILLITMLGSKDLRQPINTFVIAIATLNLIGSIVELPFIIGSSFACRWIFDHVGCILSAYVYYFVGCSSVYLMTVISMERFYTIYNPMSIKKITFRNSLSGVQICLLLGIFWPTLPLLGWSHYTLEGGLISCSVTWHEQTMNVVSYNIAIFIFVYFIPVLIIFGSNVKLVLILKSMPKIQAAANDPKIQKRLKMERHVTIVMMFYIIIFITAWTPYAIVALWSALIDPGHVTPMGATLPAVIAKSSMLWSPLFFIFSNKNIKQTLKFDHNISLENSKESKLSKPSNK